MRVCPDVIHVHDEYFHFLQCVGTADSGAEITVVIEELKSRLANAVEENARIRLKYENMEKKSRRLSDVRGRGALVCAIYTLPFIHIFAPTVCRTKPQYVKGATGCHV